MSKLAVFLVIVTVGVSRVKGHGALLDPPSRASLWKFQEFAKFQPEHNYNDNQLFCGGFQHQYENNGGNCGLCGDPFDQPQPRDHEGGGIYGAGIITRTYSPGQVINVTVDLTAYHKGTFEIKLCPHDNPLVPATQECLDQYALPVIGEDGTKFFPHSAALYQYQVKLPEGVTCRQCVLQWHYKTGNSWGVDPDGTGCMGCGNQETFRACADVKIL